MKTLSISEAAEQLPSLAELALHGRPIFIEVNSKVLLLQKYPVIELLPPGALEGVYSEEKIRQDNLFAKRSVVASDPWGSGTSFYSLSALSKHIRL